MPMAWNAQPAQPVESASSKDVLANCAPLCLLLFLSLPLAGGCILAPPLDLWPDFEHTFHKDLRE